MLETAREIIQDEGLLGLWKGLGPSLILTINPAITYGLFERMKAVWLLSKQSKLGTLQALTSLEIFTLGLFSKTIATIVTYPYIMAKVRLQWKPPSTLSADRPPYTSAMDVLQNVYKEEGVHGLFKGMSAQISKAVITQALLFVLKDSLSELVARACS